VASGHEEAAASGRTPIDSAPPAQFAPSSHSHHKTPLSYHTPAPKPPTFALIHENQHLKQEKTMSTSENKAIVARFNKGFIEGNDMDVYNATFAADFINHTAPPGMSRGSDSAFIFFNHFLRPAFPDIQVVIHDQIAEGDKVTTRKSFHATHQGEFFGVPATGRKVVMDVIDIIQLRDGKFIGHWGALDMQAVMAQLTGPLETA
jgi:predicted ester cyclase